jgi:hypothetical protein
MSTSWLVVRRGFAPGTRYQRRVKDEAAALATAARYRADPSVKYVWIFGPDGQRQEWPSDAAAAGGRHRRRNRRSQREHTDSIEAERARRRIAAQRSARDTFGRFS